MDRKTSHCPPSPSGRELEGEGIQCTLTLILSRQGRGTESLCRVGVRWLAW